MTEPSAAGGRYSEAEEEKNKENHEALQASEATMFFSVAVGKCEASPTPTTETDRTFSLVCFCF